MKEREKERKEERFSQIEGKKTFEKLQDYNNEEKMNSSFHLFVLLKYCVGTYVIKKNILILIPFIIEVTYN